MTNHFQGEYSPRDPICMMKPRNSRLHSFQYGIFQEGYYPIQYYSRGKLFNVQFSTTSSKDYQDMLIESIGVEEEKRALV